MRDILHEYFSFLLWTFYFRLACSIYLEIWRHSRTLQSQAYKRYAQSQRASHFWLSQYQTRHYNIPERSTAPPASQTSSSQTLAQKPHPQQTRSTTCLILNPKYIQTKLLFLFWHLSTASRSTKSPVAIVPALHAPHIPLKFPTHLHYVPQPCFLPTHRPRAIHPLRPHIPHTRDPIHHAPPPMHNHSPHSSSTLARLKRRVRPHGWCGKYYVLGMLGSMCFVGYCHLYSGNIEVLSSLNWGSMYNHINSLSFEEGNFDVATCKYCIYFFKYDLKCQLAGNPILRRGAHDFRFVRVMPTTSNLNLFVFSKLRPKLN